MANELELNTSLTASDTTTTPDLPIFDKKNIMVNNSAETKSQLAPSVASTKSVAVERARITKLYLNGSFPTMEEFQFAYPQATPERLAQYQQEMTVGKQAALDREANRSRTASEVLGDVDTAIGIGAARVGQVVDTAVNLPSTIGSALAPDLISPPGETEFGTFLKNKIEELNIRKSTPLKYSEQEQSRKLSEFKNEKDARQAGYDEFYGTSKLGNFLASMEEGAREFGTGAATLITDPRLLVSTAVENAPQLLTGSVISATSKALAASKSVESLITNPLFKERIDELGVSANVIFNGLAEGNEAATQIREKVLSTPIETLRKENSDFDELVSKLGSEELAKASIANDAFILGLGAQSVAATLTGKLTGSAKADASLLDVGVKPSTLKGAFVKEAAEEAINEGTGQFVQNVGEKVYVDESKSLSEDVASSAGIGAVAGPATQVLAHAAVSVTKPVIDPEEAKKLATAVRDKAVEQKSKIDIAKEAEAILKSKTKEVPDTASPAAAMEVYTDRLQTKDEGLGNTLSTYAKAVKALESVKASSTVSDSYVKSFEAQVSAAQRTIRDQIKSRTMTDAELFEVAKIDSSLLDEAKLKQLNESSVLTSEDKDLLGNQKELSDIQSKLDKVQSDIFNGSKDYKGIATYIGELKEALLTGSTTKADAAIQGIVNLKELQEAKLTDMNRIVELANRESLTDTETTELDGLKEARGISFTGKGLQAKLIPAIEVEIEALTSAARVAQGIKKSGIDTSIVTDLVQEGTPDVGPVSEETDASAIKDVFNTLSPRAKSRLKESLPNTYTALKSLDTSRVLTAAQSSKLSAAINAAQTSTDIGNLKTAVAASKTATELLDNVRNFGDKTQRTVVDRIFKHPLLEGVTVSIEKTPEEYYGAYSKSERKIIIDKNFFDKAGDKDFDRLMETLIHEAIHPVTVDILDETKAKKRKLTKQRNQFISRIETLNRAVSKHIDANKERLVRENPNALSAFTYAVNNLEEFPTKVLTDASLQKLLKEVIVNKKSVFTRLAEAIANIFGLDKEATTALQEAISISEDILTVTETPAEYSLQSVMSTNTVNEGEFGKRFSINAKGTLTTKANAMDALEGAESLKAFTKEFKEALTSKVLAPSNPNYRNVRQFEYMLNNGADTKSIPESDYLDDNIVSAMSLAALDWIQSHGLGTVVNDDVTINKILGRTSDALVTNQEYKDYGFIGSPTTLMSDEVGTKFTSFLGLSAKPSAHPDDMDKFKTSTGLAIIETLDRMGIVTQSNVDLPSSQIGSKGNTIRFVRIANSYNNVLPEIRTQGAIIANSIDQITELVGDSSKLKKALLEPVKEVPTTTNSGSAKLPEQVREALRNQMDQPWNLKKDSVDAFYGLSPDAQRRVAGYVDPKTVHIDRRDGVIAKNASIDRGIEEFTRMLLDIDTNGSKGKDTDFYFDYAVWVQGRIGMVSNWINPQANKLHRALAGMGSHKVTVDPTNTPQMAKYWIAVGNAFGIDRGVKADIVSKTKAFVELPTTVSAVNAVKGLLAGNELSKDDEAFITKVVKGSPHAFEGLVALAAKSEDTPFETMIAKEIDGITNGPVIGLTQFSLGSSAYTLELLNKGGIFSDGITTNYAQALSEGKFEDLYVSFITSWRKHINNYPNLVTITLDSLGLPFGRNEGKEPLVKTIYGAGVNTLTREFAANRLEALIDMAIAIDQDPSLSREERKTKLDAMNDKLSAITTIKFIEGGVIDQHIPDKLREYFYTVVSNSYEESLEAALEESIPDVIEGNATLIAAMDLNFRVYKGMYKVEKSKLEAKGKWTKQTKAELTAKLDAYAPGIRSYFAKDKTEGTLLKTTERVKPSADVRVEGNFKTPNSMGVKSYKTTPSGIRDLKSPGVSPASMFIQGIDASSMISIYSKLPVFGVHDAIIVGLNDEETSSEIMNEGFFDINKNYSILDESLESLKATLTAMNTYSDVEKAEIIKELGGFTAAQKFGASNIRELLTIFGSTKDTNTALRKEVFDGITYVNQYENEDGGYSPKSGLTESASTVTTALKTMVKDIKSDRLANPSLREEGFKVDQDSITSVFDGLAKRNLIPENAEHREYLRDVVDGISSRLLEPLTLHVQDTFSESVSYRAGNDVYIQTSSASLPPTGLKRSAEEHFTFEMVFNVIQDGLETNSIAKREMFKLFNEVRKSGLITPETFMDNPQLGKQSTEYATAKRIHDSMFENLQSETVTTVDPNTGLKITTSRNAYLANFAATMLSNQKMRTALGQLDASTNQASSGTLLERISSWFNALIDLMINRYTGAVGSNEDRAVVLVKRLAGIQRKQGGAIGTILTGSEVAQRKATEAISAYVIKPLVELVKSDAVLRSKSTAIRTIGLVARSVPVISRTDDFMKVMRRLRKRSRLMREGFAAELLTELKGTTDNNVIYHDLLRTKNKVIDQARIQTMHNISKFIANSYNAELTKERKEAVYKVLMKGDFQAIMDDYNSVEQGRLLTDATYLESEIKKRRGELNKFGSAYTFYVKAATDLGHFMVNGFFKEDFGGMNAHVIAEMYNTGVTPTWDTLEAESIIDKLASLESIRFMSNVHKQNMFSLMQEEYSADIDNNGVTATLGMLREFNKESLELNFKGQKAIMVKGYTKDNYNPDITITVGSRRDAAELAKQGYKIKFELNQDPDSGITSQLYLFQAKNGLAGRYDAGVVSTTNTNAKGTTLGDVLYQDNQLPSASDITTEIDNMRLRKYRNIRRMLKPGITATDDTKMVPILDGSGSIVDYRYMMTDGNREELLERDNSFDEVLGHMFASTLDKVNSKSIDRKVVEALKRDFDTNYASEPNNFVRVAKDSSDPRLQEIHRMLPKSMHHDMEVIWGDDELYVKHEHINLLFGRRKPSVSNLRLDTISDKQGVQRIAAMTNNVMTLLLNNKVAKVTEDVWKEVVGLARDAIVVKTGIVTVGNITSNLVSLKLFGVGMADIIKGHAEAYQGVLEHIKDTRELAQLKLKRKYLSKNVSSKQLDFAISIIEDRITGNPVKELIDLGIFQNIIEDVELEDDKYSYRSALKDMANPVAKLIPEGLLKSGGKTVLDNLFLTHDTAMYKFLRDSAQISDFAARYVLHKHNLSNGLSRDESIRDIVETFVNYDLPTHKSLQYGNEMGLLMFTKFSIRTQKVILKLLRDKPENVAMGILLQSVLGDVSDIVGESNVFSINYGYKVNPIPFDLLGDIVDIPTIDILQDIASQ